MKTLLITGATGFIGKHFINLLQQPPYRELYKIVLLSSANYDGFTTVLHKNYSFVKDDFIAAGISKVDAVVHIGAFTPKNGAEANNIEKSNSNINSLTHLLNNLPNTPEKLVFLSTLDVYNSAFNAIISEESPVKPGTLYGWSKLYGEELVQTWAKQQNKRAQILRIGHIYGSGEEQYQKLIPATIRKVLNNEAPVIMTKGEEIRSFLHVTDCVKAIAAAIELEYSAGIINIVSGEPCSVKDIVQTIINSSKMDVQPVIEGRDLPVRNLVFDNSKMSALLVGQTIMFGEGILEEVENFKL